MRKTSKKTSKSNDLQTTQIGSRLFRPREKKKRVAKTPRGSDAKAACDAARELRNLVQGSHRDVTGLPPEPVAHALLGFMRWHPEDKEVQGRGCAALHELCRRFGALSPALQRDSSVYSTVRAAAKVEPNMENWDWYPELCAWLRPPCLVWRGWVLEGWWRHSCQRRKSQGSHFWQQVTSQFYNSYFSHGLLL